VTKSLRAKAPPSRSIAEKFVWRTWEKNEKRKNYYYYCYFVDV